MRKIFFFLWIPIFLIGRGKVFYSQLEPNVLPPWLTGPLIAPSGSVVPAGHYNIEPYFFATAFDGTYDSEGNMKKEPLFWDLSFEVPVQVGLTEWMDVVFMPIFHWNHRSNQSAWRLGDFFFGFDFQLFSSLLNGWIPSVKLSLKENIPLGKYRNLNPIKLGVDAGGSGSWITTAGMVFSNLYYIRGANYFTYRLALNYLLPAPVHLKGVNAYGEAPSSNVRFFPPQAIKADLGMELTLSQNWAFALDLIGTWAGQGRYNKNLDGDPLFRKKWLSRAFQYSAAPAVEYNWSENLGLIAGAWFTFKGKNASSFSSGVIALNYYK